MFFADIRPSVSKFASVNHVRWWVFRITIKTFIIMTYSKLINVNVAERSEADARIARMLASRHEILTQNGKSKNK